MKNIFMVLLIAPLMLKAQTDSTYKGIQWVTALSWDQIKQKAKQENKYIFVDCYATWCVPCKLMDRDVYSNWRIGLEMNDKFISLKVQMDTTVNDNATTKNWYQDASKIGNDYEIEGFPTYLFFTPDGKLVHKELGYKNVREFDRLTKLARDPQKPLFYRLYKDYKENKTKSYESLGELAIFTKKLIGDNHLATEMAKDYKRNVLDKLTPEMVTTQENFQFILNFTDLINTKDNFFLLGYNEPSKVIPLLNGYPLSLIVNETIIREEIDNKILKDGKAIAKKPNWESIRNAIEKKYKKIDGKKLVLNYKIQYYRTKFVDWILYAKYYDEKIKLNTPAKFDSLNEAHRIFVAGELNTFGAWSVFNSCNEKAVLEKALEWIDLALKLMPNEAAYLDTKANLLYKLGKREEAIALEKKAIEFSRNEEIRSAILKYYRTMEKGEPTWPLK